MFRYGFGFRISSFGFRLFGLTSLLAGWPSLPAAADSRTVVVDGDPADWKGAPVAATDAEGEGANESLPAADLVSLTLDADATSLRALVRTAAPATADGARIAYGLHVSAGAPFFNHQFLLWGDPSTRPPSSEPTGDSLRASGPMVFRKARYVAKTAGRPGDAADASAVEAAAGEAIEFRIPLALLDPPDDRIEGPIVVKAFTLNVAGRAILDTIEATVAIPPRPNGAGITLDGSPDDWAAFPVHPVAAPDRDAAAPPEARLAGAWAVRDARGLTLALQTAAPPSADGAKLAYGAYLACGVPFYSHQFLAWGAEGRISRWLLWKFASRDDASPRPVAGARCRVAAGKILEWSIPWTDLGGIPSERLWIKIVVWDMKTSRPIDALEFPCVDGGDGVGALERRSVGASERESVQTPAKVGPSASDRSPTASTATVSLTEPAAKAPVDLATLLTEEWMAPERIPIPERLQPGDFSEYALADGRGSVRWAAVGSEGDGLRIENRIRLLGQVVVHAFLVDRSGRVQKAWAGPPGGTGRPCGIEPSAAGPPPHETRRGPAMRETIETPAGAFACDLVTEETVERASGTVLGGVQSAYGDAVRFPLPESGTPPGLGLVRRHDAQGRVTHLLTANGTRAEAEIKTP